MSLARLLLLFAIAAAARCAQHDSSACTAAVPFPRSFSEEGSTLAVPGWVSRRLHQAVMDKSQGRSGKLGRGRARRQLPGCPSLPALPGRDDTSSKGSCQALPGAGALPGHGLSMHSWVLQERTAWDLGTAGTSLSVLTAPCSWCYRGELGSDQ